MDNHSFFQDNKRYAGFASIAGFRNLELSGMSLSDSLFNPSRVAFSRLAGSLGKCTSPGLIGLFTSGEQIAVRTKKVLTTNFPNLTSGAVPHSPHMSIFAVGDNITNPGQCNFSGLRWQKASYPGGVEPNQQDFKKSRRRVSWIHLR